MREIKFRGKAIVSIEELELMGIEHNNGWVYGNLIKNGNRPIISADILEEIDESIYPEWWVVVDPESVGQYTGLKDKNGREIYERDIVRCYGGAYWNGVYEYNYIIEVKDIRDLNEIVHSENVEILGNKYENPELLGVEREMNEFCPTCSGSGGIEVLDGSIGEVITIPCPDCGGTEYDENNGSEVGMMDAYLIKIDNRYFVDTNDEDFGKVPVGGWYDEGGNIGGVILSTEREKAKVIEGNINLKSYFFRIYDATRYGTFKFDKLEIVRVKND